MLAHPCAKSAILLVSVVLAATACTSKPSIEQCQGAVDHIFELLQREAVDQFKAKFAQMGVPPSGKVEQGMAAHTVARVAFVPGSMSALSRRAGPPRVERRSDAPKGSVCHFFPGGKRPIVAEALGECAQTVVAFIDSSLASRRSPAEKVCALFDAFAERVERGAFLQSCAAGAVCLDLDAQHEELRHAVADALDQYTDAIARGRTGRSLPSAATSSVGRRHTPRRSIDRRPLRRDLLSIAGGTERRALRSAPEMSGSAIRPHLPTSGDNPASNHSLGVIPDGT